MPRTRTARPATTRPGAGRRRLLAGRLLLALALVLSPGLPPVGPDVPAHLGQARAQEAAGQPQTGLRTEPLVVVSASGRHGFTVELADTPASRSTGLMFRTELAPDAGMLFDFGEDREVAFWMRNTLIPLDMIFIERGGRIAHIARNTVPLSEDLVPSQAAVRFVLEIPGGRAAELGIDIGDTVMSPAIEAAGAP